MFPDSRIAQGFKCARTKSQALVTQLLAPHTLNDLLKESEGLPYSLLVDETTDGSCSKQMAVLMRYIVEDDSESKLVCKG